MGDIAILGAGAGGAAAVVELTRAGHGVRLWNRSEATLEPFRAAGGVRYEGVLGEGLAEPRLITADLARALDGAAGVLICLPSIVHRPVGEALAGLGPLDLPVVMNPGHTGGALELREVFRARGRPLPPVAELSTLTYIARKYAPDRVTITLAAKQVRVAALPGGRRALEAALALYPRARPEPDVLATSLANVNMVLHTPGAVLGAAWVEATGGDFTFYVQGMTAGVCRIMRALDAERRAVARAFGHDLPPLVAEMAAIGSVEPENAGDPDDLVRAISGGIANRRIRAPDSLDHRYFREDFPFGLLPLLELARIAGVAAPVAAALDTLGTGLLDGGVEGRTAARLGIAGRTRDELVAELREERA